MNRFKKEIRKRGIKLAIDYPTLPYAIKGKSPFETGYIAVDDVFVDATKANVVVFYNVDETIYHMDRDGSIREIQETELFFHEGYLVSEPWDV